MPFAVTSPKGFDKAADLAVFANLTPTSPFISRNTPLVTIGSCFAQNIAKNLLADAYDVLRIDVRERLFNPFALQAFLEGVADGGAEYEAHWELAPGTQETLPARIVASVAVIVTFGLSYVWKDRETNKIVLDPTRLLKEMRAEHGPDRHWLHPTTVTDNVTVIQATIDSIRSLNSSARIILTLSPVHLARAVADYPGVLADCVSKSTCGTRSMKLPRRTSREFTISRRSIC